MVNPALIDWIKRQEMKGYNSQQIYLHLVNNGYDQKDVIEAVNYANSTSGNYPQPQTSVPINSNPEKKNEDKPFPVGAIVFLVFIVLIGGGGFYLYQSGMYIDIMEKVGLGNLVPSQGTISDDSSSKTDSSSENNTNGDETKNSESLDVSSSIPTCGDISGFLLTCTPYECEFSHPITSGMFKKRIVGMSDSNCVYEEEMPGNFLMTCNYDEFYRTEVSKEYSNIYNANLEGKTMDSYFSTAGNSTYTIDGVEYVSYLSRAANENVCILTGDDMFEEEYIIEYPAGSNEEIIN